MVAQERGGGVPASKKQQAVPRASKMPKDSSINKLNETEVTSLCFALGLSTAGKKARLRPPSALPRPQLPTVCPSVPRCFLALKHGC